MSDNLKQIEWAEITMLAHEVATFLTRQNFQPTKFHLINKFPNQVTIIYVRSEI